MLSDFQLDTLWKSWLSAEIRGSYFGALVVRYQNRQKWLVVAGLLLSSGATLTLTTAIIPPHLSWIKPMLTVLAAASSLWSLVAKNERSAIDCADLHQRWNVLALEYEKLWCTTFAEDAASRLDILRKEEVLLSKSSTPIPTYRRLLEKVQANVMMHHERQATAEAR